jgi:crossover junction endodeoxyribonuclease RuvC
MAKPSNISMVFIGVDPGQKGAIAVLSTEFYPLCVEDYDTKICSEVLRKYSKYNTFVVLEHVHAMPQNGAVSMFNFGSNFGWWKGALNALKMPFSEVDPKRWQNHFGLVKSSKTDKPSLPLARKAFPTVDLHLKKHDGRADALCIASFGIDWYKSFIEAGGNPAARPYLL